ncbi:uncharacterized protein LOC143636315 [Bidens hawaiensis]|uniref:uncharacterized protein LOC143636315 n=1 Tax=Bidens hawaiensis TaxID=980011 RepID=UPI00404913E2
MASRPSFSNNTHIIKKTLPLPKTLLLRDYLLDDMSSCSSNGFRSYPRRQCCTTVRFLVESDLNRNPKRSNLKPKQSSVLQKASAVLIKPFKHLPFRVSTKANPCFRSLSQKLLKHGFWKKSNNKYIHNMEVKRLKSFGDLLKETEISSHRFSTAVNTIATVELTSSTSNNISNSNGNSSELTASTESSTTGNNLEVNLAQNDVVDGVGVTATNYSDTTEDAKTWRDNPDEQFSPVSVMDFPSDSDNDDEEDEVSSMPQHKHLNVKDAQILAHKTRSSNRVPQLEPVKLEDRIAQLVIESSTIENQIDFPLEDNQIEKKVTALLKLLESTVSYHYLLKYEGVKSLLLGFFEENTLEENVSDYEMLRRAKDWMDGQEQDVVIDWECETNRQTYLRDIENGVKWSNYDNQVEKVNVGLEVECVIFESLVNEVLTEFNVQESDHEY